jgi:phosphoenolpyruvate synthase/pyruvate phosphate dikinase
MSLILPLQQANQQCIGIVGAKATALGELKRVGFNVPDGFVLTTDAYLPFIAPLREKIRARLTDDVIMDPAEIESAATEIREWIQAQPFPAALRAELETALHALDDTARASLIARSSPAFDDLATSFGSGVARAYLGLVGVDEIERAIARSWAALWNSRAMYYRFRKKIVQTDAAFAVLVQPMIRAESAGVLFTQNPMGGASDEIQIKSVFGLGVPVTSARFRPDEFFWSKTKREIIDRTIEEQVVKLVVGADGHMEERAVPEAQIHAPSLSDAQVQELAALGERVQAFFGAPQDIEWAMANGEIFVLQARAMGMRNS